jgi:oligopeptide transport system ATP-binding protein
MYAGRLVETGPTEAIYGEPKHPYTLGLMKSVPRLDLSRKRELHVIKGLPPNLARLPQGCYFHPRCYLANDRCRKESPEMIEVEEEHFSACFRWNEVKL